MIEEELKTLGIEGEQEKALKIEMYIKRLREKRKWAGLVSKSVAKEPEEAILQSMGVTKALDCDKCMEIADIGSGGGILGVTLAIACPLWRVTMIESSARKCAFIAELIGALELRNAKVINCRVEDMVGDATYDAVVSRAVGRLVEIIEMASGLLRAGGRYVAIKGSKVEDEVDEAIPDMTRLGARFVEVIHHEIPCDIKAAGIISLVVVDKL